LDERRTGTKDREGKPAPIRGQQVIYIRMHAGGPIPDTVFTFFEQSSEKAGERRRRKGLVPTITVRRWGHTNPGAKTDRCPWISTSYPHKAFGEDQNPGVRWSWDGTDGQRPKGRWGGPTVGRLIRARLNRREKRAIADIEVILGLTRWTTQICRSGVIIQIGKTIPGARLFSGPLRPRTALGLGRII